MLRKLEEILLIDDNDDHVELITQTMIAHGWCNRVLVAPDGERALMILDECAKSSTKQLPDIILLDINLPKMTGHEVLRLIKANERFKVIPVIILSTSMSPNDCVEAYRYSANSYLVKPSEYDEFKDMLRAIALYWGKWNYSV